MKKKSDKEMGMAQKFVKTMKSGLGKNVMADGMMGIKKGKKGKKIKKGKKK